MDNKIFSYKDLIVWQKSIDLVIEIYKETKNFPKEELFSLTAQMRRSAISIPSNIAEGRGRGTKKDFCNFLRISLGSANELETQIEISKRLNYLKNIKETEELIIEVIKMLKIMIKKLKA